MKILAMAHRPMGGNTPLVLAELLRSFLLLGNYVPRQDEFDRFRNAGRNCCVTSVKCFYVALPVVQKLDQTDFGREAESVEHHSVAELGSV